MKTIYLICLNLSLILLLGTLFILPLGPVSWLVRVLLLETLGRYFWTCYLVAQEDLEGADLSLIPLSWIRIFRTA
jgi:hypothetical protein